MTEPVVGASPAGDEPSIFFSYSRTDLKNVRPIITAIEEAGYSVWWDGLLEVGVTFTHTTETALESARAVVVAWTSTSVASHWVRDEATRGRERGCLIPISLDGSQAPLGFRQIQVLDFSKWNGRVASPEMDQLLRALAEIHGRAHQPTEPVGATVREKLNSLVSRRNLMIGGGVVALAGGAAIAAQVMLSAPQAAANSVAVLPFTNLSGDAGQDYFSDGLSAELRAALARNTALKVMGQASSEKFRKSQEDAPTIAHRLNVAYLLDGNVRQAGDIVRIVAELIEGRTGFSRWTQTFERPMADILDVQTEIARIVTSKLSAKVSTEDALEESGGTENVAAFDAYLRGKDLYASAKDEATDKAALAAFDGALQADPQFAAAHAARARSLTSFANFYADGASRTEYYDQALKAAQRAVELAPRFADAHSTLALTLYQGFLRIKEAAAPFNLSRDLGGGDATVLARFALYCALTGRAEEAAEAIERARDLDPLNPLIHRAVGIIAFADRRYEAAIEAIQRALGFNRELGDAHAWIALALLQLGRGRDALAECSLETIPVLSLPCTAIVTFQLGDTARARATLDQLVKDHGDIGLYQQAQVWAKFGEGEKAVQLLSQAYAAGDSGLIYARIDPMLDPLRSLPEFSALLTQLGLR
jgi:TolB-like protein